MELTAGGPVPTGRQVDLQGIQAQPHLLPLNPALCAHRPTDFLLSVLVSLLEVPELSKAWRGLSSR